MGKRGGRVVAACGVVAGAFGGVFGNHLPLPAWLAERPGWRIAIFGVLTLGCVVTAVRLGGGDGGASRSARTTDSPGATLAAGDHNVVAGSGAVVVGSVGTLALPQAASAVDPLPPPVVDLVLGRDREVDEVVAAWRDGDAVVVCGGPGIGKSTVLAAAVAHADIARRYGTRRFVVSCDGAESEHAVYDKIAQVAGVPLGPDLPNRVVASLRNAACVVVLDNFETVTDADPAAAAAVVSTLRSGDSPVVLGVGFRGGEPPAFLRQGTRHVALDPLAQDDAVALFLAVAGDRHRSDAHLGDLVRQLDGIPLAVVLLGAQAGSDQDLSLLAAAWRQKRTDLLQYASNPDRTSSVPVSIELSWDRLSDDARRALSLASWLPDGWPDGGHGLYLPDPLAPGLLELRRRGLAHRASGRERVLAPVRQHVLSHHPAADADRATLMAAAARLAARGDDVGTDTGGEAVAVLAPEFTNLADLLRQAPAGPATTRAVVGLLELQRFTGLGDDQVGIAALAAAPTPTDRANVHSQLGVLYLTRSDNARARAAIDEALPLYQRAGAALGEANCLRNLAQIELRESRNPQARVLLDRARPLYQRVGNVLGEANCLSNLAQIELSESRHPEARTLLDQALPLYRRIGAVLGEANCLSNLAQIELRQSRHPQARTLLDQALPLYRRIGDLLGEANCLSNLAQIELRQSRHPEARALLDRALPLYQRVGDLLGEANCLRMLAAIELRERPAEAHALLDQALHLYQSIGDLYSQAVTHAMLARVTEGAERAGHCDRVGALAGELAVAGLHDELRAISGC